MSIKYKIKELEWSELDTFDYTQATGVLNEVYGIERLNDCYFLSTCDGDMSVYLSDLESAKEVAQNDFEDKVKEVLTTCIIRNKEHE